jgi:hypothetical protein
VRYSTRLVRIEPAHGHFRVHVETDGRTITETTRKVTVANGFGGNGGPYIPDIPDVLSHHLPKELYARTSEPIDFEALRGKSVAVLGSAASAFDAAAVALERGAPGKFTCVRAARRWLRALPAIRLGLYPGAYDNYGSVPDAIRWQQAIRFRRVGSTPPADAISRAIPRFSSASKRAVARGQASWQAASVHHAARADCVRLRDRRHRIRR